MSAGKKRVRALPKKFDSKGLRKMIETNRHYYDSNVLEFVLKRIDGNMPLLKAFISL